MQYKNIGPIIKTFIPQTLHKNLQESQNFMFPLARTETDGKMQ